MRKRGISGVVVAVLLILLAITTIILVWIGVKSVIESGKGADFSIIGTGVKIIYIDIADNWATIQLQRLPGAGEVIGIRFAFHNSESYVHDEYIELKELETKTFEIDLTGKIEEVNKVEIALILKINEQEKISPVKAGAEKDGDSWRIYDGGGGGGGSSCSSDAGCSADYYSNNYCSGNNVSRDFHNFGCISRRCNENIVSELVQACGAGEICSNGACEVIQEPLLFQDNFEDHMWKFPDGTLCTWEDSCTESYNPYDYPLGGRRYFSGLVRKSYALSWGYIYLDTTRYECEDGKCLRTIVDVDDGRAYTGQTYTGNINENNYGKGVIAKSLPKAYIDINVKQISGCELEIRPINQANPAEIIIKEPTNGWQTYTINYEGASSTVDVASQSREIVRLGLLVYPPEGEQGLNNCYIEYYIDNYRIYGDERNDHWVELAKVFENDVDVDDGEVSTTITGLNPNDYTNDISIKVVAGEPEHFSVKINDIGLSNVFPSISNLNGLGTISSNNIEVKWVSNWKAFKFNNPGLGGQDIIEVDDENLQAIDIPGGNSNKAWFSLSTPETAVPGIYRGTITITHFSGNYNIPVRVEVLDFSLGEPAIESNIYVGRGYYDFPVPNPIYQWMKKAGIQNSNLPYTMLSGSDTTSLQLLRNEVDLRRENGIEQGGNLFFEKVLGVPTYRYTCHWDEEPGCDDRTERFLNWVGMKPHFEGILDAVKNEFGNDDAQLWVFGDDEQNGCKLIAEGPLFELIKQKGVFKIGAAIHSSYYDVVIEPDDWPSSHPECSSANANVWDTPEGRIARGKKISDYIDMWITTERNYLFTRKIQADGKRACVYGYPFTDVHGYGVVRNEFWRTYLTGSDCYFQYAFDDISDSSVCCEKDENGGCIRMCALFGSGRKMGLLLANLNVRRYVDGESSEAWIRSYWDMRYLQTLIELHNIRGDSQSKDFLEIINTQRGWSNFKLDMIAEIERLRAL